MSLTRPGLIDFTLERGRLVRFLGREDALSCLDHWLDDPSEQGWVVVTGGPGMGKSALLSAWLARRESKETVPCHFVRRNVADWDQPEVIAASLAAQIEAAFPDLVDDGAKPERRLLELLGRVSLQLGLSQRLVIMVDGLDETRAEAGDNPLPRFLPYVAPTGIRLLCAMRPTYPYLDWIESRNAVRRLDLDDSHWSASNEAVVSAFWTSVAAEYDPPLPAATTEAACVNADGNVLHAVMLHDALRSRAASERRVDRLPRGLRALVGEIWDRAASRAAVRLGLGLLCAAREALSLDVLVELAGWEFEDKERFVRDARQLLLEEGGHEGVGTRYRPRHDWVRELIADRLGAATIRAHHEALSRKLATWPLPDDVTIRAYAVRHAIAHRIAADDWSGVQRIALDIGYLEAWVRATDVFAVEQGLREAATKCPAPALARKLTEMAGALSRESHWIRADPTAIIAVIWNRLRRSSWSVRELDSRIPPEAVFLRVRHAISREHVVRDGHTDGVLACAITPDGRSRSPGRRTERSRYGIWTLAVWSPHSAATWTASLPVQ
jgi:hypothetical protein